MDWPPYSPDTNLMENISALFKRRVNKRNPQNVEELIEAILSECSQFSQEIVSTTFLSIYKRINLLIKIEEMYFLINYEFIKSIKDVYILEPLLFALLYILNLLFLYDFNFYKRSNSS